MRRGIWYGLLLAVALAAPVERTDLGKLKPVEVIELSCNSEIISLRTDTEDVGSGDTVLQALEDMKATADGIIYLDTVQYLLIGPEGESYLPELASYLRSTVRIYRTEELLDLQKVAAFLRVHGSEGSETLAQEGGKICFVK